MSCIRRCRTHINSKTWTEGITCCVHLQTEFANNSRVWTANVSQLLEQAKADDSNSDDKCTVFNSCCTCFFSISIQIYTFGNILVYVIWMLFLITSSFHEPKQYDLALFCICFFVFTCYITVFSTIFELFLLFSEQFHIILGLLNK